MTPDVWQFALLLATGLLAGFVDSSAGGGGLITLPVRLAGRYKFPNRHSLRVQGRCG